MSYLSTDREKARNRVREYGRTLKGRDSIERRCGRVPKEKEKHIGKSSACAYRQGFVYLFETITRGTRTGVGGLCHCISVVTYKESLPLFFMRD